MCPHKPFLSWTYYPMLTDEGEEKTVPWMKRLISVLQLLEEMGHAQSARP